MIIVIIMIVNHTKEPTAIITTTVPTNLSFLCQCLNYGVDPQWGETSHGVNIQH